MAHGADHNTLKDQAFRKIKDDPETKKRLRTLARQSEVGIETGLEDLERTQAQATSGAQTSADVRAARSAAAESGVVGGAAQQKMNIAMGAGVGRMASFEADLVARDLAAKEVAKEKEAGMQSTLEQQSIAQDKALLQFETSVTDTAEQLKQGLVTTLIKLGIDPGSEKGKRKMLEMEALMNDLEG